MNTLLWMLQSLVAIVFLYSGMQKAWYNERELVAKGQTGVEGLPKRLIRFIGIAEMAGTAGIIFPWLFHIAKVLTPISATCLALIMVPAAVIHYRRQELKNLLTNLVLFGICLIIAYGRMKP